MLVCFLLFLYALVGTTFYFLSLVFVPILTKNHNCYRDYVYFLDNDRTAIFFFQGLVWPLGLTFSILCIGCHVMEYFADKVRAKIEKLITAKDEK